MAFKRRFLDFNGHFASTLRQEQPMNMFYFSSISIVPETGVIACNIFLRVNDRNKSG
jgi:hypothetical protein